jgi:hypothetical protein
MRLHSYMGMCIPKHFAAHARTCWSRCAQAAHSHCRQDECLQSSNFYSTITAQANSKPAERHSCTAARLPWPGFPRSPWPSAALTLPSKPPPPAGEPANTGIPHYEPGAIDTHTHGQVWSGTTLAQDIQLHQSTSNHTESGQIHSSATKDIKVTEATWRCQSIGQT